MEQLVITARLHQCTFVTDPESLEDDAEEQYVVMKLRASKLGGHQR